MSAPVDVLVRGGSVVTGAGVSRADIAVAEGRIVGIAPLIEADAREVVDAAGHYVMAGIIDAHVHFNEPGRTDWEGIATGSSALAAGGGTTFFDMPLNSIPPSTTAANVALKREAAERSSRTDFGIWGGLIPGNSEHFEGMRDAGVVGLKAFLCGSGVEEFPLVNPKALRAGMKKAAPLGMMVAVHAEDELLARRLTAEARRRGSDARTWLASRPVSLELAAIRTATDIAGETGCALHIVHVSSPEGVAAAAEARLRGVNVSVETCPHYLLLTDEDVIRMGAPAKCAPPLRSEALRRGLWAALGEGRVDTIGSDHSPAPPHMKKSDDFFDIWGGISGCQHAFVLLLSEALARGRADTALPLLTRLLSENVARRFGIEERKGRLAVGLDADITILSVGQPGVLRNDQLLYRHPQGPYGGRACGVAVVRTIVRGATVFSKGRIAPGAPGGHFVGPA